MPVKQAIAFALTLLLCSVLLVALSPFIPLVIALSDIHAQKGHFLDT